MSEEKSGGATYTPRLLADFVADQIVATANLDRLGTVQILDPAVGHGELLLSLLNKLQAFASGKEIVVFGFDTHEPALREAHRRISAEFPRAELRLETGNFLDFVLNRTTYEIAPALFAPTQPVRFDLIIANPPYVRTQVMGARQARQLASAFGLAGRVDLYHAFLVGIALALRPGGVAGAIVSNRFMTTKGGASVRAALRRHLVLRHIWDLGDTKLFDAAVLPAVIVAEGRSSLKPQDPAAFTSIYETVGPATCTATDPLAAVQLCGTAALDDGRRFRVQHGRLNSSGDADAVWRIATETSDAWLATVQAHRCGTFGDIGNIRVGVKTCADKVFIRQDWTDLPEDARPELLRPLTTHHIAARFRALTPSKPWAIVYPHEVHDGSRRPADLTTYPRSRAYLEKHRAVLEARNYLIEAGRRWYEIWVPQDPSQWNAPKLVFRDISKRPVFWLDLDGTIVNGDCYWVTPDRQGKEDLLWLAAAIANSTFAEAFYDHRFNNKLYAGRRRFITQYVEEFPLLDPHLPLVRQIIHGAKTIYSAIRTRETIDLEAQLNAMVWQAFGLPVEEIGR